MHEWVQEIKLFFTKKCRILWANTIEVKGQERKEAERVCLDIVHIAATGTRLFHQPSTRFGHSIISIFQLFPSLTESGLN